MPSDFENELDDAIDLWPSILRAGTDIGPAFEWLSASRSTAILAAGCSKLSGRALEVLLRHRQTGVSFLGFFAFLSAQIDFEVVVLCSAYCQHPHPLSAVERILAGRAKLIVIGVHFEGEILRIAQEHPSRVCLLRPDLPIERGGFAPVQCSLAQLATVIHLLLHACPDLVDIPAQARADAVGSFARSGIVWHSVRTVHSLVTALSLPAATDLETRLLESGTCSHVSHDLFDFAHGRFVLPYADRHHTLIVSYREPSTRESVVSLTQHFANDLPMVVFECGFEGVSSLLYFVSSTLSLIAQLAQARDIDPAKPALPTWAEAIYLAPSWLLRRGKEV